MIQNLPDGIFMPESRTAIHIDESGVCCDFVAVKSGTIVMTSSLAERTACLVCIGPLVIIMPALAANFLTAVGQLPWCL